MKIKKGNKLTNLVLYLIILVLIVVRFVYLDRFPVGTSHDEIEYVLSSKTYFLSGVDLSNTAFPKSIFQTKTDGIISFLPPILLAPYFGLISLNQFTTRFPYVVINIITAISIYFLVKKLFKNKIFSLISLIVFLANPWSFYLSRTASDTAFALLFYVLGILFILESSRKKLFLSFLFFILGFFSYHGAKLILIPLILVCLCYRFFLTKVKISLKTALVFLMSIVLVFGIYFLGNRFYPESINQSRSQDILFLNQKLIIPIVDTDRKASLENPFKEIFINKITVSSKIFFQKYLTAFSPEILFFYGDNRATYRFGQHGLFFIVDFIFILIGLINLYKKYPNKAKFLILLVLISPLTTAISTVETSVINRSFLLLPILIIFSSFGIFTVHKFISTKTNRFISFFILFSILLFSFGKFLVFYFFQFPIGGQENNFFSQHVIASYINRNKDNKIIVVDPQNRALFLEAVFYSSKNQKDILRDFVEKQEYVMENVIFTNECPKEIENNKTYIMNRSMFDCISKKENLKSISEEKFGGPLYFIVNDSLCSDFDSVKWLRFHMVKDYLLEDLDDSNFCKTWIKEL
ncbi:MAG: hypothetical protein PHH12_02390 [Candidatus Shapirobacteria bacterium]|nr:hypothetical protein [Candidatus Shapirobacteria bacterium]